MVKEKLLLLCKTYPDLGRQYYYRICMAGITERGELRRIFPIPINFYKKNINLFKNFHWIEYQRKDKGDQRKESYKIDYRSMKSIKSESSGVVLNLIEERITSLEVLNDLKDKENRSIGFIKPNIKELLIETSAERKKKKKNLDSQLTLFGGTLGDNYIPYFVRFKFSCYNSSQCSGHSIICEDINFWNFFKEKSKENQSLEKIQRDFDKQYSELLLSDKNLIFMMGTHFLFKTWLIISIFSPQLIERLLKDK